MKICISSDPYYPYPSGVSEYTFCLAKHLRRLGHTVQILTTHYPGEKAEADVFRVGRVFYIPMNKSFATLSTGMEIPLKVKEFLERGRFDVLHLNGPFPPSISFFALHYSRCVNFSTFHPAGFKVQRIGSGIFQRLFKKYRKKLHGLIAVSLNARDTAMPYIPGDYTIIPNGVDTERFHAGVRPLPEFIDQRPKVLYLGRLDARKGLFNLLRAFVHVRNELDDALLIVAGKGPLEKKARQLAQDLGVAGSVVFRGYIPFDEIPAYYASCDAYCSPALGGESFGIVLLEAMATGIPVAAADIPGYDRVIKDGSNGVLFDPREPRDIAKALVRILTDRALRTDLIANGMKFSHDHGWDRVAKRIENLYMEKLSDRNLFSNPG